LKNQTADVEQKTNAELNDWDRRIDQLKTEQKRVKSKALNDQWKHAIADLERKRDTVKDRLSDLKSAGADTWQTADNNLNTAEADLKNSYDRAVAKVGKTVTPHLQPETAM
jgi:F0F1-type ATP synthase membrane subunit b/b'